VLQRSGKGRYLERKAAGAGGHNCDGVDGQLELQEPHDAGVHIAAPLHR
jgi:hypothetical protein